MASELKHRTSPRGGGGGDATTAGAVVSDAPNARKRGDASTAAETSITGSGSVSSSGNVGFLTKVRRTVFPIHGRTEVTKFLLLGSIKFYIIFVLTLTRDLKDTLVVTQCGAESIAFLKIYGVLPAATAFIALYGKMATILEDRRDGKKALFYGTCVPFFVFFLLFDAVIYPNAGRIQPSLESARSFFLGGATTGSASSSAIGGGGGGGGMAVLARIASNWTSALYYVVAEIYSSVSVGVLFWQFANDVVPISQAKRFYPLFAQMSGLAPVLAGQYVAHYASRAADFGTSLHRLTGAVTFGGCMICLFYHLSTSFLERVEGRTSAAASGVAAKESDGKSTSAVAAVDEKKKATPKKKKKKKPSMKESATFLASNQYLRLIAMLVLGYGLSINFTEVMWKSLVKKKYTDPLEYQRFMGWFSSMVGAATCIVIFFGVHVIRILGWKVGALATPLTMALLGVPFFSCIFLGWDSASGAGGGSDFGRPELLSLAVTIGTIQSLLSKTSKYALFDPTTQMAYIPLDEESKVKGKAAIDVLGSRLGKSGGSLIQQGLVFVFGSILDAAPAVAIIFYSVLFAWASAANKLSGMFVARTELKKAEQQQQQQQRHGEKIKSK